MGGGRGKVCTLLQRRSPVAGPLLVQYLPTCARPAFDVGKRFRACYRKPGCRVADTGSSGTLNIATRSCRLPLLAGFWGRHTPSSGCQSARPREEAETQSICVIEMCII